MCALDRHGLLPLPRFVRVDVDRIRELLPEMREYSRIDPRTAGQRTQMEAGHIAEVVSEEALARGLNVWIDSSLRDAEWWSQELERIRRTYPHKLAILHVTAKWDRVQHREAQRGEGTGRRIPLDVLRATFKRVPAAVTKLRPLVDEYIEIDNDGDHEITFDELTTCVRRELKKGPRTLSHTELKRLWVHLDANADNQVELSPCLTHCARVQPPLLLFTVTNRLPMYALYMHSAPTR